MLLVFAWVNHNTGLDIHVGRVAVPDDTPPDRCLDAVKVATDDPGVILDDDPYDLVAWAVLERGAVLLTGQDETVAEATFPPGG